MHPPGSFGEIHSARPNRLQLYRGSRRNLKYTQGGRTVIFGIETRRNRPQPCNVRILLGLYRDRGRTDGLIQLTREIRQSGDGTMMA